MTKEILHFASTNQVDSICYYKYTPDCSPKAAFQIVHGMAEYAERYEPFARVLTELGYVVYAHEHTGHGKTAPDISKLGLFKDDKQAAVLIEDTHKMTEEIKSQYPSLKVNLMGHSMGSFVVRLTAAKYGKDYNSLVISGTGSKDPKLASGFLLLKIIRLFKGKDFKSKLVDKLSFGPYNKHFAPNRTNLDWLSASEKNVDHYIETPYCGFLFSVDGYKMLMELNRDSNSEKTFLCTPEALPVLLIAGKEDPVGSFGKGVEIVFENYRKAGVKDISIKLYENNRHEIFCDNCAQQVFNDVAAFVQKYN